MSSHFIGFCQKQNLAPHERNRTLAVTWGTKQTFHYRMEWLKLVLLPTKDYVALYTCAIKDCGKRVSFWNES